MEKKSLRRIRRENIKRLEASLPPLEAKLSRAELEHQYCSNATYETGVCDIPEKRALKLVRDFVQEHRSSSLIVTAKAGGDQKQQPRSGGFGGGGGGGKKTKGGGDTIDVDTAALKARDNIIVGLNEEKDRLIDENSVLEQRIKIVRGMVAKLLTYNDRSHDDDHEEVKTEIEANSI